MSITELSIRRPSLIIVAFLILCVLGVFCYTRLKYELLPDISIPVVTVVTAYPGAAPSEVEDSVTKVMEDAVSGIDKISLIHSYSKEGVSMVLVEFVQSANVDLVTQDVQRKVSEVLPALPEGTRAPSISKMAFDDMPILQLGVTGSLSPRDLRRFAEDTIKPGIAKISGVGRVDLIGGDEREVRVNIDAARLKALNLSLLQVARLINTSSADVPTGSVKDTDAAFMVKLSGRIDSVEKLSNLPVVTSETGAQVRLKDVAEIEDGRKDQDTLCRINGVPSIGINVLKQRAANAVEVSEKVRSALAGMESRHAGKGIRFSMFQDSSQFTMESANAVMVDLGIAIVLVACVMLLFLHSIRNAAIVMVSIPASLVSSFVGMYAFGFTLNIMTLMALSLVIGILVDDSIVVLENIHHHLEKGKDKAEAALTGRNEIGFAALAITLVDISVFLPLALVGGLIGNILKSFGLVIVVTTLLSLLVSFTLTPMLASRFSRLQELNQGTLMGRFARAFEHGFTRLSGLYSRGLAWGLDHKAVVVAGIALALICTMALVPAGIIGSEFVPRPDRGELSVILECAPGTSLENTARAASTAEEAVAAIPEVQKIFTTAGFSSEGEEDSAVAELSVILKPLAERVRSSDRVGEEIKARIAAIPGVRVRVNPIGIFGGSESEPVQIVIGGPDHESVAKASRLAMNRLGKIPGTTDVSLSSKEGSPEIRMDIDRQKLTSLGLTMEDVGLTLWTALQGNDDARLKDGDKNYPIRVRLDEADRSRTDLLGSLTVANGRGDQVELKQFASLERSTSPGKLERLDRSPSIIVKCQTSDRTSGAIAADFERMAKEVQWPSGTTFTYIGDLEHQEDSFRGLAWAAVASVIFIYLLLVALFDSFFSPFVVMFSIPVALVGALIALALSGYALSIFTLLAMIMLMGLVAKNAILLVDRTNALRAEGVPVREALMEAGSSRLRPILMTTATMVCGMLPLALSQSSGHEFKSGLAWVLIGGLASSLVLSLVLVPVVYEALQRWGQALLAAFSRTAHAGSDSGAHP